MPHLGECVTAPSFDVGGRIRSRSSLGIGYGRGTGGAVTQAGSKSTGVTLDTACGDITMNNAALAADTAVSFTLTNASMQSGDVLILNQHAGTDAAYVVSGRSLAGSAVITVRNVTAGSLSEAIVIRFVRIIAQTS